MIEWMMRARVAGLCGAPALSFALGFGACDDSPAAKPLACVDDRECADGDLCNGLEFCDAGVCASGPAATCELTDACAGSGECVAECAGQCGAPAICAQPRAPQVAFVSAETPVPLAVSATSGTPVTTSPRFEAALTAIGQAPTSWFPVDDADVTLAELGFLGETTASRRFHLRQLERASGCETTAFFADYELIPSAQEGDEPWGASALEVLGSRQRDGRVAASDSRIAGWAVEVVAYFPGERVDTPWQDELAALGPAGFDVYDVLSLGEGGEAIFGFERRISNGVGPEIAVFENAVPDNFVEFATVAVSTDGKTFAEFDTTSLTPAPVDSYAVMESRLVDGLAGTVPLGFGVAFDLQRLASHPAVTGGLVDLQAIHFVRIRDLVGDGRTLDSFGRPIWDPFPTYGSAGFDVDGIAVLRSE